MQARTDQSLSLIAGEDIFLDESDARQLLLVRAIELNDPGETVLTREDRQWATGTARAGAPDEAGFLARRAALAQERLAGRHPALARALRAAHWPGWVSWLLPAVAFAAGVAVNELSPTHRINILAFPLLGMLAWNLAVYAALAVEALASLAGRPLAPPLPVTAVLGRMGRMARAAAAGDTPLARGLARFYADWLRLSVPLAARRLRRDLHLAAACLAAGTLAGMYARALGFEYLAGWESTFIDAEGLRRLLGAVLGPASFLTGLPLPSAEHLAALRWSPLQPGENAGRWIHLYAATALLFIIVPRLALAAWAALSAVRLRRRFLRLDYADPYLRRLLRAAQGKGSLVRVLPYSYRPSAAARAGLAALLDAALGEGTRVEFEETVAYGGEDDYLAARQASGRPEPDHLLVLFSLASTPEPENQGALVRGLLAANWTPLVALLDASAWRVRLAGQAGAEARMAQRRDAWESLLRGAGARPVTLDLEAADPAAAVQLLEAAFQPEAIPT